MKNFCKWGLVVATVYFGSMSIVGAYRNHSIFLLFMGLLFICYTRIIIKYYK